VGHLIGDADWFLEDAGADDRADNDSHRHDRTDAARQTRRSRGRRLVHGRQCNERGAKRKAAVGDMRADAATLPSPLYSGERGWGEGVELQEAAQNWKYRNGELRPPAMIANDAPSTMAATTAWRNFHSKSRCRSIAFGPYIAHHAAMAITTRTRTTGAPLSPD